ncbi:MAG: MarR family transcriptional regulator [Clostridia bacterium]|nr:MarR family transcriptional regulator [Clostridia bacterium]
MALKKKFNSIYKKFKLMLYRNMFKRIKDKEETLSSTEYFCLECIYLMDKPTISQFAAFLDISSPNATYKVKTLIKKGFIQKEKSKNDGREYLLIPTQKFFDIYENKEEDISVKEIKQNLTKDDSKKVEKLMKILTDKA